MVNILFITNQIPGRKSGASILALNRLKILAKMKWRTSLMIRASGAVDLDEIKPLCANIYIINKKRKPAARIFANLLSRFKLGYFPIIKEEIWSAIRNLVRHENFDFIFLDGIHCVEYGRLLKQAGFTGKIIFQEQNVEYLLLERRLMFTKQWYKRHELMHRIKRFAAIEKNLAHYCDICIALSETDRNHLADLNPGLRIVSIPPSVDLAYYQPGQPRRNINEILFIGGLDWYPNLDGLEWFITNVFPLLIKKRPDLHLTVIGKSPPEWLKKLGPSVTVAGFVEDERVYLNKAAVLIVPIRFGSGVRIKILNALAAKKAVVSTALGAEGIPVINGESIVLASTVEEFAQAVEKVLQDHDFMHRLEDAGHRLCLEHFHEDRIGVVFQQTFSDLAVSEN